eukprot:g12134.t1
MEGRKEAERKEQMEQLQKAHEQQQARDQVLRATQDKRQQQICAKKEQRAERMQKLLEAQRELEEQRLARYEEKQRLHQHNSGAFSARQRVQHDKTQSTFKELQARRAEARSNADLQKERRRSDMEQKAAQKSQKLENMNSDRQKLWEIRKTAHREAARILRDAKKEVHRQAMSSRYSVKWLQEQMGQLENEGLATSLPISSTGSSSASIQEKCFWGLGHGRGEKKAATAALKAGAEDEDGDGMEALPRFLQRIFPALPERRELRHLQLGRLCERTPSHLLAGCPGAVELEPCGAGSLYGFSTDVVRWMVETQHPEVGHRMNYEDLHACGGRWILQEHTAPPKKSFQPYHAQSEINDLGFAGTFDFFYLPMDVHNRSNVGYAFINFLRPDDAELFRQKFSDHQFQRFQSRKISSVCTAHVQGLHENLRHFQNRAVTHARNDQYRPVVFRNGCRVDIEDILAEGKTSGSEDEKEKKKKEERKAKGKAEPKRLPTANPKAGAKNNRAKGQEGLEEAIRQSLEALQERMAHETQETPLSPPPGLIQPFEATDSGSQLGQEQEVMQLLNLRGLLLDRLLQKEENFAYNQAAAFLAMQQLQETKLTNSLPPK